MTNLEQRSILVEVPVTLRAATAEDLPKLEWNGQYRHFRNVFRRTFREQQAGRRLMLLAVSNTIPIGQVFILFKKPMALGAEARGYFYSFRVMEMFRGRGLGSALLHEAEHIIGERGYEWAVIAAAKENIGARRLYERLGYRIFAEDTGNWSYVDHRGVRQEVHEPCWMLEKSICPR